MVVMPTGTEPANLSEASKPKVDQFGDAFINLLLPWPGLAGWPKAVLAYIEPGVGEAVFE